MDQGQVTGTDWLEAFFLAVLVAVIIAILYTTSIVSNPYYKIVAYLLSVILVGVFIYSAVVTTITPGPVTSNPPSTVAGLFDPFTYDPGETATGVVVFSGNAVSLPDQYTCNLKSSHTVYENAKCNCQAGYYGKLCEFSGFDETYVSLTTTVQPSLVAMPSIMTPTLSSWPTATTLTGCTNLCTSNLACVAVTYANSVCTQYSAVTFPKVPIQTDIDPPVLDTTLYINKSRLLAVNLQGYFNIIYGVLPSRYFAGNGISSGTDTNIHVTSGGTRIGYYVVGVQTTFTGIPDWIIVGTTGTLRISPNRIPEASAIIPGQGTLVSLGAPLSLPKSQFPYTQLDVAYYVRLDP